MYVCGPRPRRHGRESELGAGEGKLLCMRWLLEKPVREKEEEEEDD